MSLDAMRDLRPLSIGELLDRAFSISFKNILPFSAIVFIVIVPEMIINYFAINGPLAAVTDQLQKIGTVAGTTPPDPMPLLNAEANAAPYFGAILLYALLVVPLANAAVVSGISRAYLQMPVRFSDCYRDAVGRWGWLVLLGLLWAAAVMASVLVVSLPFGIIMVSLGVMAAALGVFGAVLAIVIGIAAAFATIALMLLIYLAAAFSFVAAVLEKMPPGFAFRSGFQRVFGEGQLWRSLGIAAAVFGIVIGFEIVGSVVGLLVGVAHNFALITIVNGIIQAFLYPFLFAVVAVCYYDVRIRREGFDLQMLAAQLGGPSTPAPLP
ncbi:MAG: hypothetical protein ACHQY2_03390 [Candidatus Eremiobacterales bacterium]|jgi:hypothetical protein